MLRRILLNQLPGDGAPATPAVNEQNPDQTPAPSPADSKANAPAAETVANAQTTEETELLRAELEREKALRKQREQEHASVSDEFQRYKDATEARATPVPVKRAPVKASADSSYRFLKRR